MKDNSWKIALFGFFCIAIPIVIIFYFAIPEINGNKYVINYWWLWLIGIGFLSFVFLITLLATQLKLITYQAWRFNFPLAFVLFLILISHSLPLWLRILIVFSGLLIAIPINILISKYLLTKS